MVKVARVTPGSIADELGMLAGTEIRSVNGREVADFLDWEFLSADDVILVAARLPGGEEVEYEIERPEGVPLGVELEPPSVRKCANRCQFCFIEGLPKGLRRNLYIRDDDYRLSFAYGNFATLSNLKDRDVERIVEYRLSPLYVSVHATSLEIRRRLLNNPRVPDILAQLRQLAAHGIRFHCQMVIVPGMNDGAVLQQSLQDLWDLGEAVLTVAVVPVGLTQFNHLYSGEPMSAAAARTVLEQALNWGERALLERGHRWVYGSDELYLLAGVPLPDAAFYDDFPQIENGVGAVAFLRARVAAGVKSLPPAPNMRIGVVTGTAMEAVMPELLDKLSAATGARYDLIVASNSLFGPGVTTAGLLSGADIRRVLSRRHDLDMALLTAECVNDDGLFLDDVPLDELRRELPVPLLLSYDFVDVLGQGSAFGQNMAGVV
jgi:putative radical SAM enzyme (TIGR03279 family)